MKRPLHKFLIVGLLAASGVAALLFWNAQKVGRELDAYRGVPVYDNGVLFFRSYGKNFSPDGYYFGQKWQCVEFIKRFYFQAKNHRMPDVMENAKSFFDEQIPDGALNPCRGLVELFGVKRPAVTKHLLNIFKTGELVEDSVSSILEHTAGDGKKS